MGNFYVNFTIPGASAGEVAGALRKANRVAFVAANAKAKCVVASDRDAEEQDSAVIRKVGKRLSKDLAKPVLAVANEDDDVLRYWLFDAGKEVDTFDSSFERVSEQRFRTPGGATVVIRKWEPTRVEQRTNAEPRKPQPRQKDERGGDVGKLCDLWQAPKSAEKAMDVLLKEYDFAIEQHRALCIAVGLSTWGAGFGYTSVSRGELPKGLTQSKLVRVGPKGE